MEVWSVDARLRDGYAPRTDAPDVFCAAPNEPAELSLSCTAHANDVSSPRSLQHRPVMVLHTSRGVARRISLRPSCTSSAALSSGRGVSPARSSERINLPHLACQPGAGLREHLHLHLSALDR